MTTRFSSTAKPLPLTVREQVAASRRTTPLATRRCVDCSAPLAGVVPGDGVGDSTGPDRPGEGLGEVVRRPERAGIRSRWPRLSDAARSARQCDHACCSQLGHSPPRPAEEQSVSIDQYRPPEEAMSITLIPAVISRCAATSRPRGASCATGGTAHRGGGKRDADGGAAADQAGDRRRATVRGHDGRHDRQAESGAAGVPVPAGVAAPEPFEDVLLILLGRCPVHDR